MSPLSSRTKRGTCGGFSLLEPLPDVEREIGSVDRGGTVGITVLPALMKREEVWNSGSLNAGMSCWRCESALCNVGRAKEKNVSPYRGTLSASNSYMIVKKI
jgi:hypothetical protein